MMAKGKTRRPGVLPTTHVDAPMPPVLPPRLAEHQPVAVTSQDETLKIEKPDPTADRLNRIERDIAKLAEGIAVLLKRNSILD